MFRLFIFHGILIICTWVCAERVAFANNSQHNTNHTGTIGLNTVPSARMDDVGTVRAGVSTSDPYNHAFLGVQIAKPLYINLRQSMEVSSIGENPRRVYPGMDVKLRLAEEGKYRPAVTFGINSVLGNKRFSSEYFALSKRYYDFDFTAGVAWGRLGGAGHITNPFARLSSHFRSDRDYNDQNSAGPSTWFTGEEIGFFGGVEYFTPIDGLSLKADFNPDAYTGERRDFGFERPSPWGIGVQYAPKDWVSIGASLLGTDTLMARLTFQSNINKWKTKSYKDTATTNFNSKDEKRGWFSGLLPRYTTAPEPLLSKIASKDHDIHGVLHLNDHEPPAMQIGRAVRYLDEKAEKDITSVTIIPVTKGLKSRAITFSRRDIAMANDNRGSAEEIWQDLTFSSPQDRAIGIKEQARVFKFAPELALSIGEEETTHLYRASFVAEQSKQLGHGLVSGSSLRLNIADNLHRLAKFRPINIKSVRSDADLFTANRINLDRAYLSYMRTPLQDFHLAVTAGYLEEMYAGAGGEVLYRPFGSPFSVGGEIWNVYKRNPLSNLALGFTGESAVTGHLNFNYDIPDTDITAFAKLGKFIGGDVGINTGAQMRLDSGLKLKGYVSVTNSDDKDVFNSDRNIYAGMQMILPLGNIPYVPSGTEARVNFTPIGRDDAAMVDKPIDLYEVTEPTSYRRLGRSWQEVLK